MKLFTLLAQLGFGRLLHKGKKHLAKRLQFMDIATEEHNTLATRILLIDLLPGTRCRAASWRTGWGLHPLVWEKPHPNL